MSEQPTEKLPLGERPPVRTVGNAPSDEKEEVVRRIASLFGEQHLTDLSEERRGKIESGERKKEPYEQELIVAANEITNALLTKYGLTPFDIPERNIHIVNKDLFREIFPGDGRAVTITSRQMIVIDDTHSKISPTVMASTLLHESIHLKAHQAEEVHKKDDTSDQYVTGPHRVGLQTITTSNKEHTYVAFRGLNEAVVDTMAILYSPALFEKISDASMQSDVAWIRSKEFQELRHAIAGKNNLPEKELEWIAHDGSGWFQGGYERQRKVLNLLIDTIFEDGAFASRNDVQDLFFKSHFTGHLVEMAHHIDRTFGKHTFRNIIAPMTSERDMSMIVFENLQKQRRETLRERKKNELAK